MSESTHIERRREGDIEYLVLNRPEVRNAFNEDLIAEVTSWAQHAAADSGLRAVVISGAGPAFCAKIGQSAARELFLTGRRFSASHAREIGLVHEVVAAGQLDRTVERYLDEIRANGREAMAAAKALLRAIANRSIADATPLTSEAIAMRRVSEEAQGRMRAFLKK